MEPRAAETATPRRTLRLVTLNIWQEQGSWEERLALIIDNLRQLSPDVVCLQEVREVPDKIPNQARTIATALGMHAEFEVAQAWGGGDEGLAVLTRARPTERAFVELPFDEGQSRRVCLGVAIPVGDATAWACTTHLAYRLQDGVMRERQVKAAAAFVQKRAQGAALAVLAGDFNATPDADEIRYLKGLTSLDGERACFQDAFALCHPTSRGITWAKENPCTESLAWLGRDRRLDYIFVSPRRRAGSGHVLYCNVVCDQPNARGIFCSDHYGLCAEIIC